METDGVRIVKIRGCRYGIRISLSLCWSCRYLVVGVKDTLNYKFLFLAVVLFSVFNLLAGLP